MNEKFVEMELREIQIMEDLAHMQIIVLGEKYGERSFPIFIGLNEAVAMDMAARGQTAPRPLTHDLICNVIDGLGAALERCLVVKLENDTFYGALELRNESGSTVRIDARPSDAIVLAMKRRSPIFVEESVLQEIARHTSLESLDEEPDEDTE
ncbi:MAG: bifunctional nuclease family protein [bacterium]|nr:bifunctional nuclease family protein [Candidatus Sumerlaeota bacterium]